MSMLYWAIVFAIIALVAGVFGFGGVASASAGIARILFFVFLFIIGAVAVLLAVAVEALGGALARLLVVVEKYPESKFRDDAEKNLKLIKP